MIMERFIRWMLRRRSAWGLVAAGLLFAVLGAAAMAGLRQDDDLLSFFPADEPGAAAFRDIQQRFGGMRAAVVGIETRDALDTAFLGRLQRATAAIRRVPGIKEVLSLSNVPDFTADPANGGVTTTSLIGALPRGADEERALREKVMSRTQVVGQLISADGKAVLIVSLLTDSSDVVAIARAMQREVLSVFAPGEVFWVGAPFVSAYLQGAVFADVSRLGIWMLLFLLLSAAWFLRDPICVLGVFLCPAIGLLTALGAMALTGVQVDLLSGMMPMLVFVIGSAFAWVVLLRCRQEARIVDSREALVRGVRHSIPMISAASSGAAGAVLCLLLPHIEPIRSVGAFGAVGILLCGLAAVSFLPALLRVAGGARPLPISGKRLGGIDLGTWLQAHRRWFVWTWVLATISCLWTIRGLTVGMDAGSLFAADSPPARADRFLERRFGGSQYLFVQVRGDLVDPAVVRHVQWLADRISLLPHVSQVLHVGQLLATSNEVVAGQHRIPDTREQVSINYSFLSAQPALAQLISDDRQKGLIHVKIDTAARKPLAALVRSIEEWIGPAQSAAVVPRGEQVYFRVRALLKSSGLEVADALLQAQLAGQPPLVPAQLVSDRILAFLRSSECAIDVAEIDSALPPRIAVALARPGEGITAEAIEGLMGRLLPSSQAGTAAELALAVEGPLAEAWRESRAAMRVSALTRAAGWSIPDGPKGQSFVSTLGAVFRELDAPANGEQVVPVADPVSRVRFDLSGLPILRDVLARYLRQTQLTEIFLSWAWTVLVMTLLFRSLRAGVFASMPGVMALLMVGAVMALSGTTMNAGSVLLVPMMSGLGCLYAAWYSQRMGDLGGALRYDGAGVIGHALSIGGCFFILLLAELPVMRQAGAWIGLGVWVCAAGSLFLWPLGSPEYPLGPWREAKNERAGWKLTAREVKDETV